MHAEGHLDEGHVGALLVLHRARPVVGRGLVVVVFRELWARTKPITCKTGRWDARGVALGAVEVGHGPLEVLRLERVMGVVDDEEARVLAEDVVVRGVLGEEEVVEHAGHGAGGGQLWMCVCGGGEWWVMSGAVHVCIYI